MARIGFIGASGLMGHGMAGNLQRKGHELRLTIHRNRERVQDLLDAGAAQAEDAAALGAACELVFVCVTGSPEVEAAVEGPNGLLARARKGLTIIDCSTSEPASTARLRQRCHEAGVTLVDAPLARSAADAERGTLNVMVGAETSDFIRLEPVLRCFAENLFHVGGPGTGHTIKLLYNFIAQAICTATAEAFALGARTGVDLSQLAAIGTVGAINSGLFQAMAKTLTGDLAALPFALDNARKDIRYYTHLGEAHAVATPVGDAVHQALTLASALGYGDKFVPSLVEAQEKLARVAIVPRA
ncbi:MAG: NAD(P)-dependent oxidoreductase [Betaproteobacteria bacterium]